MEIMSFFFKEAVNKLSVFSDLSIHFQSCELQYEIGLSLQKHSLVAT